MARTPNPAPDCVFPSANSYGIPDLDPSLQALQFPLPFAAWGSIARRSRCRGCWHFYVDDYKFSSLWTSPALVTNTRSAAAVEPNYSTNDQMPFAVAIWAVYRKRWLARWWQSQGLPVLVDLNVSPRWEGLNSQGVPKGWRAFATRGAGVELGTLERQLQAARDRAGPGPLTFVVYAGDSAVRAWCRSRGCLWFPDQGNAKRRTLQKPALELTGVQDG